MCTNVGYIPFPSVNSTTDSNYDTPVLQLNCFGTRVVLDFGEVHAGKSGTTKFTIENPWSEEVEISTTKFTKSPLIVVNGHSVEESRTRVYKIPPVSCVDINLVWSPAKDGVGGISDSIELLWGTKKFIIRLVGFIIEVKKKRTVRRIRRKAAVAKPQNISLGEEENSCQLFRGVTSHTAGKDTIQSVGTEKEPSSRILRQNQDNNINRLNQLSSETVTKDNFPFKAFNIVDKPVKKPLPLSQAVLDSANREEQRMPEPLFVTSPFAALDTPFPQLRDIPLKGSIKSDSATTPESATTASTAAVSAPATDSVVEETEIIPTPAPSLPSKDCGGSSSGSGGDGSTGTPRKRRTWGAPASNPLMVTPTVMTRGAMKRIAEDSTTQQTFMECHSLGSTAQQTFMDCHTMGPVDSILERTSPPRSRSFDRPISPRPFSPPLEKARPFTPPLDDLLPFTTPPETNCPPSKTDRPFTPPPDTVDESVLIPNIPPSPASASLQLNVSPENMGRNSGGPLTATPRHPSMMLKMEKKEDSLPCFNTSIIPHPSPKASLQAPNPNTARDSAAFVTAAIETTSSTVDLSCEEAEHPRKDKMKAPAKSVKPAGKSSTSSHPTKSKKPEVHFQNPVIKPTTTLRPKTAPGLARRDTLKKNVTQDIFRPAMHPVKRRSCSASRAEETPKTSSDMHVRPPKRKDLVTPTMMGPPAGKSPSKRPRPLLRVLATDDTFREKRHKSHDHMPKTPATQAPVKKSRKSAVPPSTGTRVKMQSCKGRLSALPRHPLALSTASNIFYDEKWKAKEERSFTVWLNFYLSPPQGSLTPVYQNNREIAKNAARKARKSVAPPDNAKKLAKIQAERKLLQAERRACALFQSKEAALLKLEQEINEGRLMVRSDRKLDADLGLKGQLIDLLLCYNPVWLRLGLEVLYEEVLPLSEHRDLAGIVSFLNARFVNNPMIAQKYAHPTVPGSYGAGYEQELRKFTLKKFLMLILLLDTAKSAKLLEYDPCLFCLKSPHKTSRSILISFSNAFLSGEGDITKHLNYIGYSVEHEQKVIEEVDYTVKQIQTELRDGTRLTRVTEIITETSLTDKLRVPAVSRLQKLHNVGLMLTKLTEEGVTLDNEPGGPIVSKSVVDGNQSLTLALIWRIIYQYSITRILSVSQLKAENRILKDILSRKKQVGPSTDEEEDDYVLGLPFRRLSIDERGFFRSEELSALLDWCKIVCSYYDVPVDNFTVSFSDGRVLCLLVHHYHPDLIPFHKIRMQTALSHQLMELNTSRDYLSDSMLNPEQHADNEKENFRLLTDAMKGLNEVPNMIFSQDMVGTIPDERVVITFVAYLCAALVDISQDFRAAQRIQRVWRRYKFLQRFIEVKEKRTTVIRVQALARVWFAGKKLDMLKKDREAIMASKREYAARKIQFNWKTLKDMVAVRQDFLKKRAASVKIQKFYKAVLEERWQDRISAAKKIQAAWRGFRRRRNYSKQRKSAIKIQSFYRMHKARSEFNMHKAAVTKISQIWRSYVMMKETRKLFVSKVSSTVCIQKYVRGYLARNATRKIRAAIQIQCLYRRYKGKVVAQQLRSQRETLAEQIKSCVMVQSLIKGFIVRQDVYIFTQAALTIQHYFKSYLEMKQYRTDFLNLKDKAITLQKCFRGYLVRKEITKQSAAATKIQKNFRGYKVRSDLNIQHQSAMLIQAAYLRYRLKKFDRIQFQIKRDASILIQSCFRGYLVRKETEKQNAAATKIQTIFRGYKVRSDLNLQNQSVMLIQAAYLRYRFMKFDKIQFQIKRNASILIQSCFRGYLVRKEIEKQSAAATKIQTIFRGYKVRSDLNGQHQSAMLIQAAYLRYRFMKFDRIQSQIKRGASILIQSCFRGYLVRKDVAIKYKAAVIIQRMIRGYQVRSDMYRKHRCARIIQMKFLGYMLMKAERSDFEAKRFACIRIQSYWRMRLVLQKQSQFKSAAICVQTQWRMFYCRKSYLNLRNSAVSIQRCWRNYQFRKAVRVQKIYLLRSVLMIQSTYRGITVRDVLVKQHSRATLIQSVFRGYLLRKQLSYMTSRVIFIQSCYRGYKETKACRSKFQLFRCSAIIIQSYIRARIVRNKMAQAHSAATKIQSHYRGYRMRKEIFHMHDCATLIQNTYRRYKEMQNLRSNFLAVRCSTIIIQAHVRSYLVRQAICRANHAATTIQAQYRRHFIQRAYQKQRCAAITIQQHLRAWILGVKERKQYNNLRRSVIVVQSLFRGNQIRKQLHLQHSAASKIQATWRMYVTRSRYLTQVEASVLIQSIWRMYKQRQIYLNQHEKATKIQAWYRMYRQRRLYRNIMESFRELERIRHDVLSRTSSSEVEAIAQLLTRIK